MRFDYVINKIIGAELISEPFEHIQIHDLFNEEDLDEILSSPEIRINKVNTDKELISELLDSGYKVIEFPGCTTKISEYLKWHKNKNAIGKTNSSCEGFGVVLRLKEYSTPIICDLIEFLNSKELKETIAEKFNISRTCTYDAGIQKYLDGYEISPHPDIRRKAATYMVNINPHSNSESLDHHTHYLTFNKSRSYIKEFWSGNKEFDRCWVPWNWCNTVKRQVENNSMVLFSPSNDTMHSVKADYDHLEAQRTQLYGNLWYEQKEILDTPSWEDLNIRAKKVNTEKLTANIVSSTPTPIKNIAKKIKSLSSKKIITKRDY